MKKHISIIFLLSFLYVGCLAQYQYGAGVEHRNGEPTATPQYNQRQSLIALDTAEQSLYVNNKRFGWWRLMSPQMRYVRGFISIKYNDNQIIPYSFIHTELQNQSLSNNPLNGLYIVKFNVNGGNIKDMAEVDMASIPNLILAPSSYMVSNNDLFLIRYERGILKNCTHIIDKTRFYISQIDDTLKQHRAEIDSLKKSTPSVSTNFWGLNGNTIDSTKWLGTKNAQDLLIKTNDSVRVVIKNGGFSGFGVLNPGAYVDGKNFRNRGQYYDYFGNSGQRGQRLASLIQGTMWVDDYKFLTLQHTAGDENITVGKSKNFVSVPNYLDKLTNIFITTINNNFSETTTVRVLTRNAIGQDVLIGTLTIQPGGVTASLNLSKTVDFDLLRLEVTQAATGVKGLSATFTFLDTQ